MDEVTRNQIQDLEEIFETFNTPGWKLLHKEFMDYYKSAVETAVDLETEKDFFIRKGNVQTLTFVLNIEDVLRNLYENLTTEDEADADV